MTTISDKELKRSAWKTAYWRALGIVAGLLGAVVLAISVTGDKSWSTIAFGLALIALGLSYHSRGQSETTDFKLNVINSKIDHIHEDLVVVSDFLSSKAELDRLKGLLKEHEGEREKDAPDDKK